MQFICSNLIHRLHSGVLTHRARLLPFPPLPRARYQVCGSGWHRHLPLSTVRAFPLSWKRLACPSVLHALRHNECHVSGGYTVHFAAPAAAPMSTPVAVSDRLTRHVLLSPSARLARAALSSISFRPCAWRRIRSFALASPHVSAPFVHVSSHGLVVFSGIKIGSGCQSSSTASLPLLPTAYGDSPRPTERNSCSENRQTTEEGKRQTVVTRKSPTIRPASADEILRDSSS